MAIITRVAAQKNRKNRYSVFIDDGSGERFGFGVNEDVLIQFGLRKGFELTDELIEQIMHEEEVKKALHQCYSFLSFRMRTEKEVSAFLKKKGVDEQIAGQAIAQLKKQHYVNDLEFAKSYVRDKMRFSTKGPLLIQKELKEKGISEEDRRLALEVYSPEEQLEAAVRFLAKKAKQAKRESQKALRQKLGLQLQQKGFTYEIIEEALQTLPEKSPEDEREALRLQAEKAHQRYKKFSGFDYKRRMKQYLYSKGFSIGQIHEVIEEMHQERQE